jgi:hypothetical protein
LTVALLFAALTPPFGTAAFPPSVPVLFAPAVAAPLVGAPPAPAAAFAAPPPGGTPWAKIDPAVSPQTTVAVTSQCWTFTIFLQILFTNKFLPNAFESVL